jgi:KipI family sensor histidine kinase inhibitor
MAAANVALPPLTVEALGDRALRVVLGQGIDPAVNRQVHQLAALIRASGLQGVEDLVPAYSALTVHYDPVAWAAEGRQPFAALAAELRALWLGAVTGTLPAPRQVEIPVCYGGDFGPDLADVARLCGLTEDEIVRRHCAAEYLVYLLGFAPGFPYLGGLDPTIAAPRRGTPRMKVPAGAVGIAGMQTGIYPLETPGGWQIIGRTPRKLFDPAQEEPCLLKPGDLLQFVPMDETAYRAAVAP